MNKRTILLFLLAIMLAGCSRGEGFKLPGLYRVDVQQGNVIEQEMIDRLKPGMEKEQVSFIMGTPAIRDPFHSDQWDYIYSMSEGGGQRMQRHVRIYFEDEKLAYIDGDVVTALRPPAEITRQSRTVDVPIKNKKEAGFFRRMINVLPFVGEDEPEAVPDKSSSAPSTGAEQLPPGISDSPEP